MRLLILAALPLLLAGCGGIGNPVTPSTSHLPSSWGRLDIQPDFIPKGRYGRHRTRPMDPRYVTIHATENYAASADARAHSRMLRTGALTASKNSLGYVTWHFTVDDHSIWQSLPCNEQGQHADYEGPGNKQSIGIEMCENRGNSRAATLDRTARLTAVLMKQYGIPLRNVVPHGHWRMIRYADGRDLGHKNCPHFLLSNSQPTAQWHAFIAKVNSYHRQL